MCKHDVCKTKLSFKYSQGSNSALQITNMYSGDPCILISSIACIALQGPSTPDHRTIHNPIFWPSGDTITYSYTDYAMLHRVTSLVKLIKVSSRFAALTYLGLQYDLSPDWKELLWQDCISALGRPSTRAEGT